MFWFLLTLIGQFAGEWREPPFVGYWAIATDGRVTDATPRPTDGPPFIARRKAEYRRAREAAERDGHAKYESDGKPGSKLPAGWYDLWRVKGEVLYDPCEPPKKTKKPSYLTPVPRPDPAATLRNFRTVAEDCIGQA